MAKKYPARPPAVSPRAEHAAQIVALGEGEEPYAAPLAHRGRISQLIRYYSRKLDRRYVTRTIGKELVIWRTR